MKKTLSIVGQKFRGLDPYLAGTETGVECTLVREPDNKFDKNAIQVWIGGQHVGYLPSKQNADVAAFIDRLGFVFSPPGMAADAMPNKAIKATFRRSPNSGFPQAEFDL